MIESHGVLVYLRGRLFAWSPTYPELARVSLASKAYWLTFSPDGRWALVALSGADQVAVVDAESRDVVAQLSTGAGPKRNLVIELDQLAGTLSGEARY